MNWEKGKEEEKPRLERGSKIGRHESGRMEYRQTDRQGNNQIDKQSTRERGS